MNKTLSASRFCVPLLLAAVFLSSALETPGEAVADLVRFPQDPFRYLTGLPDAPLLERGEQERALEEFRKRFFAPWEREKPAHAPDAAMWAWRAYNPGDGSLVGANLRPPGKAWFEKMEERAAMECYGTVNKKAVTVRETDLRNFPTIKPLFREASLPGEGYPFDYLQQTALKPGEPLFVSHLSREGGWAFVESPQAAGWVDVRDMAYVDDRFISDWMSRPLAAAVAEEVPLSDPSGRFVFHLGIGGVLPLSRAAGSRVRVPLRAADGNALAAEAVVSPGALARLPLEYTPWNAAKVMRPMTGQPYGWGGLTGNRDCSATLRDLFTPFGLWLPRHSSDQAARGRRVDLSGLSGEKKQEQIKGHGVPFRTLLWMPGHVMLYVGTFRGDVAVFHTFWGLRTIEGGREGRKVVGQTAFTSLEPGKELTETDPEAALLERVESMTILFGH